MSADLSGWLGVKYGILGQQASAAQTQASAALAGTEGIGALRGAQAGAFGADAEHTRATTGQIHQGLDLDTGSHIDPATGRVVGPDGNSYSKGTASVPASPAEIDFFHQHLKAQHGMNKVPGKGPSTVDTVPAMLAPREAVLNEHAANLIGRDKIAAANAIGVAHQKAQGKGMVAPKGAGPKGYAEGTPSVRGGSPYSSPQMDYFPPRGPSGTPQMGWPRTPNDPPDQAQSPKPQKLSGGTHMVGHGKSAKTPTKIDPQALLSLMGAMQGGQAGGPPQPMQGPGGMV